MQIQPAKHGKEFGTPTGQDDLKQVSWKENALGQSLAGAQHWEKVELPNQESFLVESNIADLQLQINHQEPALPAQAMAATPIEMKDEDAKGKSKPPVGPQPGRRQSRRSSLRPGSRPRSSELVKVVPDLSPQKLIKATQAAEDGVYEIPDYRYQAVPSTTAELIPSRKGSRGALPPLA